MFVTCLKNKGDQLSKTNPQYSVTSNSNFYLTIGSQYRVFGQFLSKERVLFYLVFDETSNPCWYQAELFAGKPLHLPSNWFFSYIEEHACAIWGYEKLVADINHFDGLSSAEDEALIYFFKLKDELEKAESLEDEYKE